MLLTNSSISDGVSAAAVQPLRTLAGGAWPQEIGGLVGLEHEYQVLLAGAPANFRQLIHHLAIDGLRIDPADGNAYRLASGLALTADGAEAEIASPPVNVSPGFTREVRAWAAEGHRALAATLPGGASMVGYSTHISVAMPDEIVDAVADLYSLTFAPAFALLIEGSRSNGVYIRPRPGRLELCGEFVDGRRLGAVAAFAVGSARACAAAVRGELGNDRMLPRVVLDRLAGVERYGIRVQRFAAGLDLYGKGRESSLPVETGGTIGGQELLSRSLQLCREFLGDHASPEDLRQLANIVDGKAPLGVEAEEEPRGDHEYAPAASPFGQAMRPLRRPAFSLAPLLATWDFIVYRAASGTGESEAFVLVPRTALPAFITAAEGGGLDGAVCESLRQPPAAVLTVHSQTRELAIFGAVTSDPTSLLPEERAVQTATTASHRAGSADESRAVRPRPGKRSPGRLAKTAVLPGSKATPLPFEPGPRPAAATPAGPTLAPARIAPRGDQPTAPNVPRAEPQSSLAQPAPLPDDAPRPAPPALAPVSEGGIHWWPVVVAAAAAVVGVAAIVATLVSSHDGKAPLTPTPHPAAVATETPKPSSTPAPTASTTNAAAAATAIPPTATPTQSGSVDPATAVPLPTASPTNTLSRTPVPPTNTPTTPTITRLTCPAAIDRNVQVHCTAVGGAATSISWSAPGGTPNSASGSSDVALTFTTVYTLSGPETVTVKLCNASACRSRSVVINVL